jgi:hypothetical protein
MSWYSDHELRLDINIWINCGGCCGRHFAEASHDGNLGRRLRKEEELKMRMKGNMRA